MNCCLFLHLLGLLFTVADCVFPAGSCDGYTNISDPWRNSGYSSIYFRLNPHDDTALAGFWWRFTGVGGDILVSNCSLTKEGGNKWSVHVNQAEIPQSESSTATTVTAYNNVITCEASTFRILVVLCPGGFYIYQPVSHLDSQAGYLTRHSSCQPDSCGPLAVCYNAGSCKCISGYDMPSAQPPPPDSYGCQDINECRAVTYFCGSNANCTNYVGGYNCTCWTGYNPTDPTQKTKKTNPCIDIDECVYETCGDGGVCVNTPGSFQCQCFTGYYLVQGESPPCKDIDECLNATLCGPSSICTNMIGLYNCACEVGFRAIDSAHEPNQTNICIDVDECVEDPTICGSNGNCTNTNGSFICSCFSGYRLSPAVMGISDPCIDIDECSEMPGLCGIQTICLNKPGTYYCSCSDGFYPSTGIIWTVNTFCKSLLDILDELNPSEEQTKERAFLAYLDRQLQNNNGIFLPEEVVANCFSACMETSGVGPRVQPTRVSSAGDGETGTIILSIAERLISAVLHKYQHQKTIKLTTSTTDLNLLNFGPGDYKPKSSSLSANGNIMEINMESLARNNNGSAAAAFLFLNGMESLLSHEYFETENRTELFSDVVTALLPTMTNTKLTEPVNFTLQHKKVAPESGLMTCVYWKADEVQVIEKLRGEGTEENKANMSWSEEGCWVSYSNESYTICSCSHLSTFALILQTGEPPPENDFLEWLNRICVIIGLFFFALAILTFLLCSWNPKINNTARLHLCINLGSSHLLLLFNEMYIEQKMACKAFAGLLHFLVVASFVWMLLEAVQLYLLVRRLNKVQVIERDGLPQPVLYIIGYGVPFVIVGVSALVYHRGYGATPAKVCWLSQTRSFNWALTGPVITVLALNCLLFCATLWSLRTTLANMKSGTSESKDTKLVLFKIVAQFVILGCTWILGLYQSNLFFQILFIVLNSQQGTFLYIVHCLLNKEIREECLKCLTCSRSTRNKEDVDGVLASEDLDKTD